MMRGNAISTTKLGEVFTLPGESNTSAFGAKKVTQEFTKLHLQFVYGINPYMAVATTSGGGIATTASSMCQLSTSTGATGSAQVRSRKVLKYTPGQGVLARFTAIFSSGVASSRQEIGIGNLQDGFFFGYNGDTFGIIHRRAGNETFIPQSFWNGDRSLSFSPQMGNVYEVSYQWLGFGPIRFYITNAETSLRVLVHTIRWSNAMSVPSMGDPTLPLWARVANSGNTSNLVLKTPSMGAVIEAPPHSDQLIGAVTNRKTGIGGTATNIVSIRNNTTFGGITSNIPVNINYINVSSGGTNDSSALVVLNPTVGGVPSFTQFDPTGSIVSYDTAGTTVTGGRTLLAFVCEGNGSQILDVRNYDIQLIPGDVLVVAVSSVSGTVQPQVAINWGEEW